MSYTVTETTLAPIPNIHGGTGIQRATNWVVEAASVPGSATMAFTGLDEQVTTKLFEISDAVVPNWFGVALPRGLSDFTRPHIFFHPTPGQAGYVDGDYANKTGKWPELFYYMERLGYQLDGARRNQILIMPFMTEEAKNGGILPANWRSIVIQILKLVRADIAPSQTSSVSISQLVVSSFSAGIIYSDSFRRTGANVASGLAEVWDFDGLYSSYHAISEALHSTATVQAIKYDQVPSANASAYHVPLARWAKLVDPPTSSNAVHGLIRDFMFLDAASVTGVGGVIDTAAFGTTADTGTHSATGVTPHTGTGTHSGTSTHTARTGTVTPSATAPHTAHTGTATHSGTVSPPGETSNTGIVSPPVPAPPAAQRNPTLTPVPVPSPQLAAPGAPTVATPIYPGSIGVPPPPSTLPLAAPLTPANPRTNCCRPTLIPSLVAPVATVAQTSVTAIAAIAARPRKPT
jgi:hypothetical protein